jgi:hypothetical protein
MSPSHDDEIVHRTLETDQQEPAAQIATHVADLSGRAPENLTTAYEQIDHVLEHIFSNPPQPEAQVQITFSYEGYRITVEQDGSAQFVEI